MNNDIDWTEMETEKSFQLCRIQGFRSDFWWDIGHSSDQEPKKMVWNAHPQTQRILEPLCRDDNTSSRRQRTCRISSDKCVRPRICERRWRKKSFDSLQQRHDDRRAVVFAQSFPCLGVISDWCQELAQQVSAQSFSSTVKLVAKRNERLDWRALTSNLALKKTKRLLVSKSPRESQNASRRHQRNSNWRNRWFHENSFSWTLFFDDS